MTLSGNLGFVPLDEVLRLLTRAGNDGMVQITNTSASGRIFVAGKGISLATTMADFGLKEHLASSGYISQHDLDAVDEGTRGLGEFFTDGSEGLALLREMTVESIYQLDADDADFQVIKDQTSQFASPVAFDLEGILSDSLDRREQWRKVGKTVTDLDATVRINRELDRDSVELKKDSWRLIAALGNGASVRDLAKSLGTTEFSVAKVAADLIGSGLVSLDEVESIEKVEQTSYQPAAPLHSENLEPVSYQEFGHKNSNESDHADAEATVDTPVVEAAEMPAEVAEAVHEKSWWDEPEAVVAETVDSDETVVEETALDEVDTQPISVEESAVVTTDDDTEAFLEKVFSDLGDEAESTDDGHGLMRRRRMGSILRELGED
jgi:hypothetical protein